MPTAGNFDTATFNTANTKLQVTADTNVVYNISNIVLHTEALQLKTQD